MIQKTANTELVTEDVKEIQSRIWDGFAALAELADINESLRQMQSAYLEAQTFLNEARDGYSSSQQETAQKLQTALETIDRHIAGLDDLKNRSLSDVERGLGQLRGEIERLRVRFEELEAENRERVTQSLSELSRTFETYHARFDALRGELQGDIQSGLERVSSNSENQQRELQGELQSGLERLRSSSEGLQHEVQARLDTLQVNREAFGSDLQGAFERLENTREDFSRDFASFRAELEARAQSAIATVNDGFREQAARLEDGQNTLQSQAHALVQRAQEELGSVTGRLNTLEDNSRSLLQTNLESFTGRLNALENSTRSEVQGGLVRLQEQVANDKERLAALERSNSQKWQVFQTDLQNTFEKLSSASETLQSSLNLQVKELRNEVDQRLKASDIRLSKTIEERLEGHTHSFQRAVESQIANHAAQLQKHTQGLETLTKDQKKAKDYSEAQYDELIRQVKSARTVAMISLAIAVVAIVLGFVL